MSEGATLNEHPTPRPPLKSLESLAVSDASASTSAAANIRRTRDFYVLPIPSYLLHDPGKPPPWSLFLNIIFAAATTIFVANLYYCQPILLQLSQSLGVSSQKISNVPTLIQAGLSYATGLFAIAPLGDLVPRRPLVLLLASVTTALTFGLAFTNSFIVFEVISFILGVTTCLAQVLAPLTADLAPPHRRASALSILLTGVLLGILYARVMAGLIAQFVSWRVVYYVAIGMQAAITALLYFTLPDYPVRNTGITYGQILLSMLKYSVTEPLLIQASLVCMVSMACFSNFWVTLTFLLGGPPYNYSTLVIGLFGLVGVLGVFAAPLVGRTIDHLVPWFATVIATIGLLLFQAIQTGAGGINIAAVVIVCFGIDVFRQYQQVSLTTAVFGIEERARSRMNAVVLLSVFLGQIMGTAVGTQVFIKYGWRPAAALSVAWSGFTLVVMLARGPHCARYTWFGYEGGLELRKRRVGHRAADGDGEQEDVEKGKTVNAGQVNDQEPVSGRAHALGITLHEGAGDAPRIILEIEPAHERDVNDAVREGDETDTETRTCVSETKSDSPQPQQQEHPSVTPSVARLGP